ncbi:sporulation integral membrane protein YlbJ [Sporolactobacillus shoreae]|uniref:Sporulation integral membrane protein YlbJ n=1 Tax=Sporolactobacillus shoreae TaxID=1465501 RepID=A0A4Z0GT67_9BACL|nr:sporulation integral membrane protein YlbJ [Sporolactobacillus shoreae]TGB00190.1 sporulation integral membrane protein YlbJ [Sporolactobacillus shoreae]
MIRSKITTYLFAACSAGIVFLMVRYPVAAVSASYQGLQLWWEKVFPALFPFFVMSELMIGFGVVTFAGVLMEPLMRPVFKVPGIGGFVFVMGLFSGFPAGARMTARLYQENKLSKYEAERLSSFTNFSNPLFLFNVIAVQFFHQAALGIVIALAHYLGNIGVGLVMRFYNRGKKDEAKTTYSAVVFTKALRSMHEERVNHFKPFGKMLGDAVVSSVQTLLAIGGFIALFSMAYHLLAQIGVIKILSLGLAFLIKMCGFSSDLGPASIPGIFELTIGAHEIGAAPVPLIERIIFVSGLLGFCGFSIQAQAIGILSQAGLSARPFLLGRIFHAFFSGCAAWILYHLFHISDHLNADPAFLASESAIRNVSDKTMQAGPMITALVLFTFAWILIRRILAKHGS